MTTIDDVATEPAPVSSPRRRDALRTLAGIGAAGMALLGRNPGAGASPNSEIGSPAGPERQYNEAGQISASRRGPTGPRGRRGKRGPTGPAGPPGPAGTLTQFEASAEILEEGNANAQANCESGLATGGGGAISNPACSLVSSGPVGFSAWGATGACPAGAEGILTVKVICLE